MKFKKLNIHSFGHLKDKEIVFKDNLNVIYGRNESGKSTISAFMEAMLYGYPPRDPGRKKYIPWDSSFSQGSMTVEHKEEAVTIYRKLTASSTKDITEISPKVNLHEFIPKDRETYRKSVYCSEGKAADFGQTDEILMRIANIVSTGDENINAQKAIARLEEFRKTLKPKKGSGGKLNQIQNEITALENKLESIRSNSALKEEYNHKLTLLENRLNMLTKKRDSLITSQKGDIQESLVNIDREIATQKEYLNSFPNVSLWDLTEFKFPLFAVILYILFSSCALIISFFINPWLCFSALFPIFTGLVHFYISKSTHKKKEKAFLAKAGCNSIEELKKMISDKENAKAYYEKLLVKREQQLNSSFSESLKVKNEISALSTEMIDVSNSIISLKSSFAPYSGPSEDEIASQLNSLKEQRKKIITAIEALDGAIDAINYGKSNLSKTLAPIVNETAMGYMEKIAPKKGRNITLSKDLTLFLTDPMPQDMSSCSFGLKEEIYICYRIALSEYLYGKDFPLIFDDPFLGSDDYREKALIDLFLELSKERQIIIFTNRKNPYYNQVSCNFIDITPTFDV